MKRVIPMLQTSQVFSGGSGSPSFKFNSHDLEGLEWERFLNEIKLPQHIDLIIESELTLMQFLKVDCILMDNWLRELKIPLKDRAKIIFELRDIQEGGITKWLEEDDSEDDNKFKDTEIPLFFFIPYVNLVGALFGEVPDIDSIKSALELLGIMSALQFTIMLTVPVAYDHSVYADVVRRFGEGGEYEHCFADGYEQIEHFALVTATAIVFSFVSFILVMVYYIVLVYTNFKSNGEIEAFWIYLKWGIVFCIIMITGSIVSGFLALESIIEWNFPNEKALNGECTEALLEEIDNPWGLNEMLTEIVLPIAVMFGILFVSLGLRSLSLFRLKTRVIIQGKNQASR